MTTRRLGNTLQAPRQKQRLQLNIPLGSVRLLLPFFLLLLWRNRRLMLRQEGT